MTNLNQLQILSQLYPLTDDNDSDNSDSNLSKEQKLLTKNKSKSNDQLINETNFKIDKNLINKCKICLSSNFKYKCPSCLMETCSLDCFKQHKIKINCTSLRNSLKFKRLANFEDNQLKDDFKFLEDHNRQIDGFKRQKRNLVQSLNDLPNWLKKLKYEANRRLIKLKLLPAGFKRRLQNKTTFMYSSKEIHWDIELIFTDLNLTKDHLNDRLKRIVFHINRVSEKQKLKSILMNYLKPSNLIDNYQLNNLLKLYQNANEDEISILIKLSFNYYIELDLESTINNCLKNKTIIEYPTLFIVLKQNLFKYKLLKENELKIKMQEYADKSFDCLIRNGLVRKNFNDFNKQKLNENQEDDLNDCNNVQTIEFEQNNYQEESDNEPTEIETKYVFDNSYNQNLFHLN